MASASSRQLAASSHRRPVPGRSPTTLPVLGLGHAWQHRQRGSTAPWPRRSPAGDRFAARSMPLDVERLVRPTGRRKRFPHGRGTTGPATPRRRRCRRGRQPELIGRQGAGQDNSARSVAPARAVPVAAARPDRRDTEMMTRRTAASTAWYASMHQVREHNKNSAGRPLWRAGPTLRPRPVRHDPLGGLGVEVLHGAAPPGSVVSVVTGYAPGAPRPGRAADTARRYQRDAVAVPGAVIGHHVGLTDRARP